MAAKRYLLRLRHRRSWIPQAERKTNLDPHDEGMLRTQLEEMVKEERGTLQLDLSDWCLYVHRPGGGQVVAIVEVDPSGRTVVRR